MNFSTLMDLEHLKSFLVTCSFEEFQILLGQLNLKQFLQSITVLQHQSNESAQFKLIELFRVIDHPKTFENLGKELNEAALISFLDFFIKNESLQNRLPHLFKGLDPSLFFKTLYYMDNNHFQLLANENLKESMLFQVQQFMLEADRLLYQISQKIHELTLRFQEIDTDEVDDFIFLSHEDAIGLIRDQIVECLEITANALSFVWQTDQVELIDKINKINESFNYQLHHGVGHPARKNDSSTGLYQLLECACSKLFEGLADEDRSIEGLTRLSIWHLKDYEELGLIQLSPLIALKSDSKDIAIQHKTLFALIQTRLNQLKIENIADLKREHLFSRSSLANYINKNKKLITY